MSGQKYIGMWVLYNQYVIYQLHAFPVHFVYYFTEQIKVVFFQVFIEELAGYLKYQLFVCIF